MDIRKALKEASEHGQGITRKSWQPRGLTIIATNTISCCLMVPFKGNSAVKMWAPHLDDLLADDWEVIS